MARVVLARDSLGVRGVKQAKLNGFGMLDLPGERWGCLSARVGFGRCGVWATALAPHSARTRARREDWAYRNDVVLPVKSCFGGTR